MGIGQFTSSTRPAMGIRAIAVDLGGVLLLSNPGRDMGWAAKELGLSVEVVRQEIWKGADVEAANRGQITAEEYFARSATRLGVSADRVGAVVEALFAGVLNEPMVNWLASRRSSLRIAAFTNNWSFADRILANHRVSHMFDTVVNSADVGCCKPDPCMFAALLARLDLKADEIVVVDDQQANIDAANILGFHGVRYEDMGSLIRAVDSLLGSPGVA
jgi:putative hydrolase of the HAD superfamily